MALTWTVNFDWTTAGTFDTSRNDAARMVDYRLSRGRRDFINASGNGLEAVEPGMLQIKLDNWDGVYDPYNTSSVLYPKVEPGRFVQVVASTNNTKSLLHMDGANNGTVFTDEIGTKTWTASGSAVTSTTQKKFGASSLYCPDSSSYISITRDGTFDLYSYDWTFAYQVRVSSVASNAVYTLAQQFISPSNVLYIIANSTVIETKCVINAVVMWNIAFEWTPSADTWYHIEICRHGDEILAFLDGVKLNLYAGYTPINPSNNSVSFLDAPMRIGGAQNGNMYLDEFIFQIGIAAHISDFTPPTSAYEEVWRHRFTGRVDSVEKIGDVTNPQVLITAYDGLKELQNNTITTAIKAGNPHGLGTQITYLTTSAEWPAIYGTSSIGTGNAIVPYAWANEKSAFQTIKDLVDTEAGLFCAYADGRFMFRSREATTSVVTLDQSIMLKDILLTSPYKLNRNAAKVYVYDKSLPEATAVKLWRMNDVPLVSTAAGLTVWGRYKYSGDECLGYDMVAPADTTDFKMNTKADGTGTDRTAKWDVTTTYFGEVSKNVISRVDAVNNHYCTLLKNRGKPIVSNESTYKIYDKAGTAAQRTLVIDSPFIQSSWQADFYDSFMTQLVATTLRFPIFQLESQPASQFEFDLFDKITVTIPKYGINGDYLVGGIDEEWITDNGQAVLTTVYTEPDIIVTPPATLVGE